MKQQARVDRGVEGGRLAAVNPLVISRSLSAFPPCLYSSVSLHFLAFVFITCPIYSHYLEIYLGILFHFLPLDLFVCLLHLIFINQRIHYIFKNVIFYSTNIYFIYFSVSLFLFSPSTFLFHYLSLLLLPVILFHSSCFLPFLHFSPLLVSSLPPSAGVLAGSRAECLENSDSSLFLL